MSQVASSRTNQQYAQQLSTKCLDLAWISVSSPRWWSCWTNTFLRGANIMVLHGWRWRFDLWISLISPHWKFDALRWHRSCLIHCRHQGRKMVEIQCQKKIETLVFALKKHLLHAGPLISKSGSCSWICMPWFESTSNCNCNCVSTNKLKNDSFVEISLTDHLTVYYCVCTCKLFVLSQGTYAP